MLKYLLKRLVVLLFTLLGISMITFAITRIAPGDPATLKLQASMNSGSSTSQAITKEIIEENRKLYGFDKPIFLNFRKKGKSAYIQNIINSYIKEKKPSSALKKLAQLNVLAIPYLLSDIQTQKITPNKKKRLVKLIGSALGFTKKNLNIADLNQFYQKNKQLYQRKFLETALFKYLKTSSTQAKENLLKAKAAAVPVLIHAVLSKEIKAENLKKSIEVLSTLTKKPWQIDDLKNQKDIDRTLYYINRFWNYEREKYEEFSFWERFTRTFSDSQFGMWISKLVQLDFDISYAYKKPVSELILEKLPVTLQLNLISIVIIYFLSLYVGVYSSTIHNSSKEKAMTVGLFILYSLPSFWVANLLIMFFTGGDFFNLFPSQYLHSAKAETFSTFKYIIDWLWHLCLPVFVMVYGSMAYLSRQMKVSMLEVLNQDYIRTARAKGLSENKVIYKHALRNALIPIITLLGGLLPSMLGGSVIIEEIFNINGMGKLSFEAIMNRDYPVINAIAFLSAFLTLLGILISDLLYVLVDPRIKLENTKF